MIREVSLIGRGSSLRKLRIQVDEQYMESLRGASEMMGMSAGIVLRVTERSGGLGAGRGVGFLGSDAYELGGEP